MGRTHGKDGLRQEAPGEFKEPRSATRAASRSADASSRLGFYMDVMLCLVAAGLGFQVAVTALVVALVILHLQG